MTLEQQVTSVELSARLHTLGILLPANFTWCGSYHFPITWVLTPATELKGNRHPAYTAAELLAVLPGWNPRPTYLKMWKTNAYELQYQNDYESSVGVLIEDKSLANAAAKMLIYLLENNLLTLAEINKEAE